MKAKAIIGRFSIAKARKCKRSGSLGLLVLQTVDGHDRSSYKALALIGTPGKCHTAALRRRQRKRTGTKETQHLIRRRGFLAPEEHSIAQHLRPGRWTRDTHQRGLGSRDVGISLCGVGVRDDSVGGKGMARRRLVDKRESRATFVKTACQAGRGWMVENSSTVAVRVIVRRSGVGTGW